MKIEIEITPRRIADLLITAIEGGCNYWCGGVYLRCWNAAVVDQSKPPIVRERLHHRRVEAGAGVMHDTTVERTTSEEEAALTAAQAASESHNWYDCPALFEPGSEFEIVVVEDDPGDGIEMRHTITQDNFAAGFKLMAEKHGSHFGDFMNDNEDATTADVWLQCVALKDVIYG